MSVTSQDRERAEELVLVCGVNGLSTGAKIEIIAGKLAEWREGAPEAGDRLEELHELLDRKNRIIRLLAMGDLTAEELKLSDDAELALLP